MSPRSWFLSVVLILFACAAWAKSPCIFFDESQIPEIRKRIARPEYKPTWDTILKVAEAYCDPKSKSYIDPNNPLPLSKAHDVSLTHGLLRRSAHQMEILGVAYRLTGREKFGQHGAAMLATIAERYPVTGPPMNTKFAGIRGDLMHGLAVGYDFFSERLTPEQRKVVTKNCADYLDYTIKEFTNPKIWWYGAHNYNGVNAGAAGCLTLALRDDFPKERIDGWIAEFKTIINRWLDKGFDEDGACYEGVLYSNYGLTHTVIFADALLRTRNDNLFSHPTFRKLVEYYIQSMLPGERFLDARNDSSYRGLTSFVLRLAGAKQCGRYKWLWEKVGIQEHTNPLPILWDNNIAAVDPITAGMSLAQHFEGRGLCVWRTGWDEDDVMFSIEAGPYVEVTHNQADKGHFTLYGLGRRWATDPGYDNSGKPKSRGQTLAHSCILIDGQGQATSGAGIGTDGKIVRFENNDRFGYALADCTEAYCKNSRGLPGAMVRHAKRHAFFVYPYKDSPAYVVMLDDVYKDDQAHTFTWQMMYGPRMQVTLDGQRATFQEGQKGSTSTAARPVPAVDGSPRLVVHVDAAMETELSTDVFVPEDGQPPAPFPRFRATARSTNPRFLTILLPLPHDVEEPTITTESTATGRLIHIAWPDHVDTFEQSNANALRFIR